jgi:preprotein translocase subunit SecG
MSVVISILLIISALILIVTVLLQSSDEGGIGALSGQSNSYFSKSKAKTFEARLALGTKIAAGVFVVLSILKLIIK